MTVQIHATRTLEGLSLLEAGIVQAVGLTLRSAVKATEASAKATTRFHDRTGETRGSIRGEIQGFGRGRVIAGGASRLLEEGTVPHTIVGRPLLRFVVAGQVLFRRSVKHPGTAARPFMSEARAVGEQTAAYGAEYFVSEAIRRTR